MEVELGDPERDLYRLLYCSRATSARPSARAEGDIEDILQKSRQTNPVFGITGVRLSNRTMFSHMIEGPEDSVQSLFGHIACDSRHQDTQVISRHGSGKRIFREWSMAHVTEFGRPGAPGSLFPSRDGQSGIIAISLHCSAAPLIEGAVAHAG